jgi:hypothetical protein
MGDAAIRLRAAGDEVRAHRPLAAADVAGLFRTPALPLPPAWQAVCGAGDTAAMEARAYAPWSATTATWLPLRMRNDAVTERPDARLSHVLRTGMNAKKEHEVSVGVGGCVHACVLVGIRWVGAREHRRGRPLIGAVVPADRSRPSRALLPSWLIPTASRSSSTSAPAMCVPVTFHLYTHYCTQAFTHTHMHTGLWLVLMCASVGCVRLVLMCTSVGCVRLQAYLSHVLAFQYGLDVVTADNDPVQTAGAQRRLAQMHPPSVRAQGTPRPSTAASAYMERVRDAHIRMYTRTHTHSHTQAQAQADTHVRSYTGTKA